MSDYLLPMEGVTPGSEVIHRIESLDESTKDALIDELIRRRQDRLNHQLAAKVDHLNNKIKEQGATIESLRDDVKDGIDASLRRTKGADNYYTRTQLGLMYAPVISAPRMTRLLRAAGIVTQYGSPMAQYREGTEPLSKLKPYSERETWLFHKAKLDRRLKKWMVENDLYEDFHNTATKQERDSFIDFLYEEFGGDLRREDER